MSPWVASVVDATTPHGCATIKIPQKPTPAFVSPTLRVTRAGRATLA
jgi:hypothetical protein